MTQGTTTPNEEEIIGAVKEADEWLMDHRHTETWRTMNRLRDTLVRTVDRKPEARRKAAADVIAELVAACAAADVPDYNGEVIFFTDALLLYAETPGMSAAEAVARVYETEGS